MAEQVEEWGWAWGGGDNVELLIHEITELCEEYLKAWLDIGGLNRLGRCGSSVHPSLWQLQPSAAGGGGGGGEGFPPCSCWMRSRDTPWKGLQPVTARTHTHPHPPGAS